MKVRTKFSLRGAALDSYLKLVTAFPLASIRSEEQLHEAQKVMDQLLAGGALSGGEEMYLDALSDLVATYEDAHHAIEPASDADMLRHLMHAKGLTQAQLSKDTLVPKSTISEILAGKKPFSRKLIHVFAEHFQVDASVLAVNFSQR
jgi:HTH-type transcriptional regulator/antitoxin HigA